MIIYYFTVPDASIAFVVKDKNINRSAYIAHKDWVQENAHERSSRYMTNIMTFNTLTGERKSLGLPKKKK